MFVCAFACCRSVSFASGHVRSVVVAAVAVAIFVVVVVVVVVE